MPSLTLSGVGTEFYLAMTVGPEGRLARIENLCSSASVFGLSTAEARDIAAVLHKKILNKWRDLCIESGLSLNDIKMLEPSFEGAAVLTE